MTVCVVVEPLAGTGMLAIAPILSRSNNPVVPAFLAVRLYVRFSLAAVAFDNTHEYGIVTVHLAVFPVRVAATVAESAK
ncbi:MAG TPA: hypothetical protein VHK68_05200 [Gemmatimonadales bacterium]|nr:hypothetical protein [Gemmatimonadales bacterium]